MKQNLLFFLGVLIAQVLPAQFSSGITSLGTTGMTVKLDTTPTTVTLTITGNSNSYLGIGAGDIGMEDGADGFIYNSTSSRDYTFNGVGVTPSPDVNQNWTVISNTVAGGIRTIVATRSLSGGPEDAAIPNMAGPLDIFFARGDTTTLAYHGGNRGYATLMMTAQLGTLETETDAREVSIYPNPATEILYFKNHEKTKKVEIFDFSGRRIQQLTIKGDSADISMLKAGTYFIEFTGEDGNIKFVKFIKK